MTLFNWGEIYKTDIPEIDDQHKHLIELANELHNSIQENKEYTIIKKIIFDLVEYTRRHFSYEEQFIKKNNPDEFEHHHLQHKNLIDRMTHILKSYSPNKPQMAVELLELMKFWIIQHIRKNDSRYI